MTRTFKGITPEENCKIENVKVEIIETEETTNISSLTKINCDLRGINAVILNLETRLVTANNDKIALEQDKLSIQTEVAKIEIPEKIENGRE